MRRAPKKVSYFDQIKNEPHDKRFVAFNDMPSSASKYAQEPVLFEMERTTGREVPLGTEFVPPHYDYINDLEPSYSLVHKRLDTGYVEFDKFEDRKPFIKSYEKQAFHTMDLDFGKNPASPAPKVPPFEVLGNKRRTDKSLVFM